MDFPIFEALLEDEKDGITTISWVKNPATMIPMLCFSEDDKEKYTFMNDEKMMATSVVMVADTKIYRNNNGFEYYITYSADTLIKMCEKMLYEDTFKSISFQHDGQTIDSSLIKLVELYTVDENKKSPFDVPKGSIIATYKITDANIWNLFKSGEIQGISLEGYFSINELTDEDRINSQIDQKYEENTMNIKDILKRILTNFTETPVGESVWVYDGELTVGTKVTLDNGELVEDGEYEVEGKKIVIKDSIVESVENIEETTEETTETETEETTSEEMKEETETTTEETVEEETTTEETETTSEDNSNDAEIDALKSEIETIKSDIEQIKELINQIAATPAASVATEEFEQIKTKTSNRAANMLSYLR